AVTGVQTCALPIWPAHGALRGAAPRVALRRGDAADHAPRRPQPSGAEHVRGDRPSGDEPEADCDRSDSRYAAEDGPLAGTDGGGGQEADERLTLGARDSGLGTRDSIRKPNP